MVLHHAHIDAERNFGSGDLAYVYGHYSVLENEGGQSVEDGHYIELATLKPGDFFGEIALVDEGPRSADVQALEECTLLKITQAVISAVAGVYPTAAFKFLIAIGRIMVSRLRRSTQRYVDSLLFPVAGKD